MSSSEETHRTRLELDGLVVSVELTLLSIVQGVVLTFLAGASREPLLLFGFRAWPYILTGLLIVLVFWSRAMIHTFTLIRWPLEFGHNFLYIACALVQALMLGEVGHARAWNTLGMMFVLAVWVLFAYDLRLIRARIGEGQGPAGRELFAKLLTEQLRNVRIVMPIAALFQAACLGAVIAWPERIVARGSEVVLIVAQLVVVAAYQGYVLRWYVRILPLILRCRDEWRREVT